MESTTSFGSTDYGDPCPPSGARYYHFTLYALDSVLNLPSSTNKDQLESSKKNI
ncbi:hypothetical protein COT97_02800 [Candidatus Falkowbacteria bacterium CG10_big_fil_rev_8_21_14_0_10_39_11]|uniref:YbhB/YbcL family Raf kinase inhibitor-like protein n=1 Tax=Candidatus Falkowbacteria bacterium CG10_big_fil_rev_8_21_14_0_10_39_11 TaxID=1974565 RepID=A0A2H0V4Y0_9BACT|nr:MAG: hypothetical protein COT97_02800 [Candidatus Falkowbacteria bacterium CG10_big_fil_rev_8_21_14_0_10_39_11]